MSPRSDSEYSSQFYLYTLKCHIIQELTGKSSNEVNVVKVNTENLDLYGDLYLPLHLNAWRNYIPNDVFKCSNILEYYMHLTEKWDQNESVQVLMNLAINSLIVCSNKWPLRIAKCSIQNERIIIHLDRPNVITTVLKSTMRHGKQYGCQQLISLKTFNLKIDSNKESELTCARLRLLKDVCENILCCQGHNISDTICSNNYMLTTNSKGRIPENVNRYVCSVVKNSESNTKEVSLTWKTYFNRIFETISEISFKKVLQVDQQISNEFLHNVTDAVIAFELLSVKPTHTISIKTSTNSNSALKGATFILYNTARISAILNKYNEKRITGEYPELSDIDEIDFSVLKEEEEWKLVYNFILIYPEVVQRSVRHEPTFEICPQHICSFLYRLCQIFSIYYRKTRVLVERYSHLVPVIMARLYLLKAIEIVLHNALKILNVDSVSCM